MLLLVLFLAFRFRDTGFDWSAFSATLSRLRWGWLALSLVAIYLTYVGRALRWAVLMRPVKRHPRFWSLLSATFIGFTGLVLFGRPGELVRPYLIATREKVPVSSQLAAWFLERVYDFLSVIVILGAGLSQVHVSSGMSPALTWLLQTGGKVAAAFGLACLILLFMIHRFGDWTERRLTDSVGFLPEPLQARVVGAIRSFLAGMKSTGNPAMVFRITVYSALEWVTIFAATYCAFQCLPETARLSLADTLTVLGLSAFGGIVQLPGIGGGFQVVTIMVLTELFGIPVEAATGAALVLWVVNFASVVPVGLFVALHEGVNWKKLRHLEDSSNL